MRHATHTALLQAALACAIAWAVPAGAEEPEPGDAPDAARESSLADVPGLEADPANVDAPVLPRPSYLEAFRLTLQSDFVPDQELSGSQVAGYMPSSQLRVTIPLGARSVMQATARFDSSLYDVKRVNLFGPDAIEALGVGTPERYWGAALRLQGAHLIADEASIFLPGESWSFLWEVDGSARWHGNAFGDSLEPGASIGFGYETRRLRLALGVRAEGERGQSGYEVGPVASVRWRPTDRLTLRNRGLGAQLEYRLSPSFEVFLSGYSTGRSYLMEPGALGIGSLTFKDEQTRVGGGFEWRAGWLRINLEAGVLLEHELELDRVNGRTISSVDADGPSPYFTLRLDVRPRRTR